MKRVVITGIGAVTPLANNFNDSWAEIKKGSSGIGRNTRCDTSGLPWKVAGEVKGFETLPYLTAKERLRLDPFVQYAVAAAHMACEDAGVLPHAGPLSKAGIIIGSSRGGITTIEKESRKLFRKNAPRHVSPYLMPSTTISIAASYTAQKLGIKGHCLGISNACASGANAIGESFRLIRNGHTDLMLAGGAEAPLCRLCIDGYGISGALSKINNASASRPFDRARCGFILAEGAAVLVLEEYESARKRKAPLYAEIIGYSSTTDAFHLTKPDPAGEAHALSVALEAAGVLPGEIDYINAHGASTLLGDKAEAQAIRAVFGGTSPGIPVSSVKSMTGHMLAASGAFEAACTSLSIREGIIPPTLNLTDKDPECDINVIAEVWEKPVGIALSNSFGFGGVNAVLVLKKCRSLVI